MGMSFLLPFKYFTQKEKSNLKQVTSTVMMAFCDVFATILDSTGLVYVSFNIF